MIASEGIRHLLLISDQKNKRKPRNKEVENHQGAILIKPGQTKMRFRWESLCHESFQLQLVRLLGTLRNHDGDAEVTVS